MILKRTCMCGTEIAFSKKDIKKEEQFSLIESNVIKIDKILKKYSKIEHKSGFFGILRSKTIGLVSFDYFQLNTFILLKTIKNYIVCPFCNEINFDYNIERTPFFSTKEKKIWSGYPTNIENIKNIKNQDNTDLICDLESRLNNFYSDEVKHEEKEISKEEYNKLLKKFTKYQKKGLNGFTTKFKLLEVKNGKKINNY